MAKTQSKTAAAPLASSQTTATATVTPPTTPPPAPATPTAPGEITWKYSDVYTAASENLTKLRDQHREITAEVKRLAKIRDLPPSKRRMPRPESASTKLVGQDPEPVNESLPLFDPRRLAEATAESEKLATLIRQQETICNKLHSRESERICNELRPAYYGVLKRAAVASRELLGGIEDINRFIQELQVVGINVGPPIDAPAAVPANVVQFVARMVERGVIGGADDSRPGLRVRPGFRRALMLQQMVGAVDRPAGITCDIEEQEFLRLLADGVVADATPTKVATVDPFAPTGPVAPGKTRIRMITSAVGPGTLMLPGRVYDVPADVAKLMIERDDAALDEDEFELPSEPTSVPAASMRMRDSTIAPTALRKSASAQASTAAAIAEPKGKTRVRMLGGMVGPNLTLRVGDLHVFDSDVAERLIANGDAELAAA
jgi:hypothetical protein